MRAGDVWPRLAARVALTLLAPRVAPDDHTVDAIELAAAHEHSAPHVGRKRAHEARVIRERVYVRGELLGRAAVEEPSHAPCALADVQLRSRVPHIWYRQGLGSAIGRGVSQGRAGAEHRGALEARGRALAPRAVGLREPVV